MAVSARPAPPDVSAAVVAAIPLQQATSSTKLPGEDDPSTTSVDRAQMDKWVVLVSDVLGGAEAMRSKGETYLPRYSDEGLTDYARRLQSAPWRPEFADMVRNVSSKPFEEEVSLQGDDVPDGIREFAEDVDGRGNNMTQFCRPLFASAVAKGVVFLVVDFPSVDTDLTLKEAADAGARPYWLMVEVDQVVAMYTETRGGREVVVHFRYRESVSRRVGFAEERVERVRVYDDGRWAVYEQDPKSRRWDVALEDGKRLEGEYKRGSTDDTSAPVVPLFFGERLGVLKTRPPMLDLAVMQVELWRALSRKDEVLEFAASPVLVGNGMKKPSPGRDGGSGEGKIVVGPKSVLYAPAQGASWTYINPESSNIEQVRKDVSDLVDDMRRLGMQPLTQNSGTQSATGESIDAATANSTCKAWALRLKDVVEQAYVLTCQWLDLDETVEVSVFTDFSVMPFAQAPLNALQQARSSGDLSRRTYWDGLRRFDALPQDFSWEAEEERILDEDQQIDGGGGGGEGGGEQDVDPVTGEVLDGPAQDPVDTSSMKSYDDLSEEDLRSLVGDDLVDAALAASGE